MSLRKRELTVFGYIRESTTQYTHEIPTDIIQIIIAFYYFCCEVYAAGFNKRDEWGISESSYDRGSYIHLPRLSELLQHPTDLYQAECAIFVKHNNEIYGAGDTDSLGMKSNTHDETVDKFIPLIFPDTIKNDDFINIISSGHDPKHSIFVTKQKRFFGIGANHTGQLISDETFTLGKIAEISCLTNIFQHKQVIKIQCAPKFTIFLTKLGHMFSCGSNTYHECGIETNTMSIDVPTQIIIEDVKFMDVLVGREHTLCLSDNKHKLYAFGRNDCGQLAMYKQTVKSSVITFCSFFEQNGIVIVGFSVGGWHNWIVTSENKCYSFGFNEDGQCGHDTGQPAQLKEFMNIDIDSVYCGLWHTMVLTKSNELYGLGYNANGEVSVASDEFKHWKPYHLTRKEIGIESNCKIIGVVPGYQSTLILVESNE